MDHVFFEQRYIPVTESGCWIWTGYTDKYGYGYFKDRITGKSKAAHRLSYELFRGSLSSAMQIDHLCKVRCCVNPLHLEMVSQYENIRRGNVMKRRAANDTHCLHGHEYTADNIIIRDGLYRRCRACTLLSKALYRATH